MLDPLGESGSLPVLSQGWLCLGQVQIEDLLVMSVWKAQPVSMTFRVMYGI